MAPPKKKDTAPTGLLAENRKAKHSYLIGETLEAGLVLQGSEVRSLRMNRGSLNEAFVAARGQNLMLCNFYIAPHQHTHHTRQHEARRPRILLIHARQQRRLASSVNEQGMTIIPLRLYSNHQGKIKVMIALARGKKLHDKRAADRERDWQRDKQRLLRRSQTD